MSGHAGYAGAQVEVDDLHRVRAIFLNFRLFEATQAELEKLNNEMWTNPSFAEGLLAGDPRARRFTRL